MRYNQAFGKWGEETAAQYLKNQGLKIIKQNWKCSYGEIDIVAQKEHMVVFVEVKTRKNNHYGLPEEAITRKKREHLIHTCMAYINAYEIEDEWRIDIIAVQKKNGEDAEIEWFENAIRENE